MDTFFPAGGRRGELSASWRDALDPSAAGLPLLLRLRWLAVPGQLLGGWAIAGVAPAGIGAWLLPAVIALSNLGAARAAGAVRPARLAGGLILLDTGLLTYWLAQNGGAANPLTLLFLTLIALAALVLGPVWTWVVAAATSLAFLVLLGWPEGVHEAAGHGGHSALDTHLRGMFIAFVLAATLTALFVSGLRREVDARDAELAQARAERSRNERLAAISSLVGNAVHELATPVAALALAGEEVGRRLAGRPLARTLAPELEAIAHHTRKCRRILDDLAHKAGNPRGESPRRVMATELIAAAAAELAPEHAHRLVFAQGDAGLELWVPPRAVVGALSALLRNAFDASPREAAVEVSAAPANGERVALIVRDRGHGLDQLALDRVGEPFFTTKEPGQGLGLGLFMARTLAEQLEGELLLCNRPGGGAEARLTLPRARA